MLDQAQIGRGCLAFQIRALSRTVSVLYDAALAQAGLKTTQFSVLVTVLNRGPIKPGELAKSLAMDESTLSRNVDRMCARGWLKLHSDRDRRSHRIALTDKGRALIRAAYPAWQRIQDDLSRRLGPDGVAALKSLGRKLRAPDNRKET